MNSVSVFKTYYEEIILCLNAKEVAKYLYRDGLIDPGEVDLCSDAVSRKERNKRILEAVIAKGPSAYSSFLKCLEESTDETYYHKGHAYIVSLLDGRESLGGVDPELQRKLQKQFKKNLPNLEKGINFESLSPYLLSESLLTESEFQYLTNFHNGQVDKFLFFKSILETKGPEAHYLFTCCLGEEDEHKTHRELFKAMTRGLETVSFKRPSKSRKRGPEGETETPVTKRVPDRVQAEGTLSDEKYFMTIRQIRYYHLNGKWSAASEMVEKCNDQDIVFQIAIILENCTGHITRQNSDSAFLEIGEAKGLCKCLPPSDNNRQFLQGRCEWALAKLYRYIGKIAKARDCIQKAAEIQSNIELGEDAALTNYCRGCILLECLSKPDLFPYSEEERRKEHIKALDCLERAISYASDSKYGLDLSHPRIRLAQLYLGSSPSKPGTIHDSESICSAKNSLQAVDFDKLAPRTQCIYYFTQSDLVYSSSKEESRDYAQRALDIAEENEFKTEVQSAQARLDRIDSH